MAIRQIYAMAAVCLAVSLAGWAQPEVNVDQFLATLDLDKDGSISRSEWKDAGLMEVSFSPCDPDKNDRITKQEMEACALPEANDSKKEGILTVFAGGRFVIMPLPGTQIQKPAKLAPGITQVTQFVADSPYVEGAAAGEEFIRLFDEDKDGKVSHMEWEKLKNDTPFRPFRWPQYNKNRDEWITVEEAPKKK